MSVCKMPKTSADITTVSACEYYDRVTKLLEHICEITSSDFFDNVDPEIWNDVSLTEPEIVYSE